MVRTSITAEIRALLEHGLADLSDHDGIALGIILAQIAGRERALLPVMTSELDASNAVNGSRREYHTWFLVSATGIAFGLNAGVMTNRSVILMPNTTTNTLQIVEHRFYDILTTTSYIQIIEHLCR